MSKFYYLDVSLEFDSKAEVNAVSFKSYILSAVKTLFGDFGASIKVDLLKYNKETCRGVIRCPAQEYVKVRGSLTFCGKLDGNTCRFLILIGANMSVCKKEGKDIIIFADKEDHDIPSKVKLPELEPQPGLIFPNGEINWNCPCLGGMATGPCGVEFREAFSCFHYSEAEPKGSDCVDLFKEMQSCMTLYPALYDNRDGKGDDDDEDSIGDGMGMNIEQPLPVIEQPDKLTPEASMDTKEKQ